MDNTLLAPILLTAIAVLLLLVWYLAHKLSETQATGDGYVAIRQAEKLIIRLDHHTPGRDAWLIEHGYGIEAEALRRAASGF